MNLVENSDQMWRIKGRFEDSAEAAISEISCAMTDFTAVL